MKNRSKPETHATGGFWKTPAGTALIAVLIVAAFIVGYDHRAHLLTEYGLLVGLLLICIVMHIFMHHGHGGHGRPGSHGSGRGQDDRSGDEENRP